MKANVGGIDRIVRIALGLALVAWAVVGGPMWAWIGLLPIATGAMGWCPPYAIFGWNTCAVKKPESN